MSELSTTFDAVPAAGPRSRTVLRPHDWLISGALAFSALAAFGPLQHLHLLPIIGIVAALFVPVVTTHRIRIVMPLSAMIGGVLLSVGGIASVFASVDRRESIWQLAFAVLVPLAFYVGIGTREWRWRALNFYVAAFAVGCTIPLLAGLLEFNREFGIPADVTTLVWARFDVLRMAAYQDVTYGNVLHTADLLLLVLPPLVALIIEARSLLRVVAAAAAAVAAANVLIVAARGATVILVVSLGYLLWRLRNRRAFSLLVIVACAWVYTQIDSAALEPVWQRYQALAYGADASGYERLDSMKNAIALFQEHAISGVGLGNYYLVDPVYTAAHQMILHVGVEAGIFGLLGMALILGSAIVSAVRVFRRSDASPVVVGCAIGLLAFTIQALSAGSNFAVVGANVWGMLFWFFFRVCEESTLSTRPLVIRT